MKNYVKSCSLVVALFMGLMTVQWANGEETYQPLVRKIWDQAPHNAFTDLVKYRGKYYCTFREGTGHVPGKDGKDGWIRVLVSNDGEKWESCAKIEEQGVDLRDPKISVTPDDRLMLLIGGSFYDGTKILKRQPRVCFYELSKNQFTPLIAIQVDESIRTHFDWLWRVTWHPASETGYGIIYQSNREGVKFGLHLVKTNNGIDYQLVKSFEIEDFPNEATLRFLADDTLVILLRREKNGGEGLIGHAQAPYTDWTLTGLGHRLGGPNFIVLNDGRLLAGTRKYVGGAKTILAEINPEGKFEELIEFPSGGDTSYPGMIIEQDEIWFSYYSSHEGKTSIYLTKIPLSQIIVNPGS